MVRELKFEDQKATYLLLNIMAHDVIHDYGPGSSDARWENNLQQVKRFRRDNYTFGGQNLLKSLPFYIKNDHSVSFDIKPNDSKKIKIEIEPPNNYINSIHELKEDITTSILFSIFDKLKYTPKTRTKKLSQKFSVYHLDFLLRSKCDKKKNYNEIIKSIIEKIEGVFVLEKQTEAEYTIKEWLIKIIEILSKYSIVETAIVENPITIYSQVVNSLKNKLFGGADTELNPEECQKLINEMNTLLEHTSFTELQEKYNIYINNINNGQTPINKKKYMDERSIILGKFKEIFIEYEQQKKAGSIEGDVNILPPVNNRQSSRNAIKDLKENFEEKLHNMLAEYTITIKQHNVEQAKIEAKQEAEKIKLEIEKAKKEEKKRLKEIAENAGNLTSDDKEVRQQFVEFIAKSGLFVTGVCDKDGNIEEDFNEITEESLITQINILFSQANWINTDDTQPTKKRKKEVIKWRTKTSLDLDGLLINHFNDDYKKKYEIKERYVCPTFTPTFTEKYVVNNAAPIDNALTDKSFCPYTSILDGMSQCSYKSSTGNREYGNMDFKIMSDKTLNPRYYHGKLNIGGIFTGFSNEGITINLSINPGREISIDSNITTTLNGHDLKAHYVLKNTLISIIDYISGLNENEQNQILSGNIFENLFRRMSNTDNNGDFNRVYSHILIKGTGDLFQEINCVCKHGGYSSTPTTDSGILEYPPSGDQLRLFVAKDRPSGTRFIYMLINGNPHEINTKAVGGYYSTNYTLLVKHPDNTKVCERERSGGRKRTLKHHKNIPRRTRKRNHHIK